MARTLGDNPVWDACLGGTVTMTTSFVAFASATADGGMVCFSAAAANTGKILITDAAGSTAGGLELAAGEKSPWIPISNLSKLAAKSSVNADTLYYLILK